MISEDGVTNNGDIKWLPYQTRMSLPCSGLLGHASGLGPTAR